VKLIKTPIEGVVILEPRVFEDARGFFMETYQQKKYAEAGINCTFVQDNLSCSSRGVLRGLHYQLHHQQAKLVQVIRGEVFDVAVDVRPGSPTFGNWAGVRLSEVNKRQLFIPQGFAHGFCVISATALFQYKCTDFYAPDDEGGILFSDPDIDIIWPISDPILSDKDKKYPLLKEIPPDGLPAWFKDRTEC